MKFRNSLPYRNAAFKYRGGAVGYVVDLSTTPVKNAKLGASVAAEVPGARVLADGHRAESRVRSGKCEVRVSGNRCAVEVT